MTKRVISKTQEKGTERYHKALVNPLNKQKTNLNVGAELLLSQVLSSCKDP